MSPRLTAWRALVRRYREHFCWYWKQRHAMTPPALKQEEAEFLPAAVALQLAPVSPTARWTARILMLMVLFILLWAVLGKVDIIVSASGKIIPSERAKTIAAVETARVAAIYVTDGQTVRAGQPLLMLDSQVLEHEELRAAVDQDSGTLQVARSRALLASLAAGHPVALGDTDGVAAGKVEQARAQLESQWHNVASRLQDLDGEIARYAMQVPIARQREQNYRQLAQNHDVAVNDWHQKEQERIELEGKLADARHQREAFIAETRKNTADELSQGLKQQQESQQDRLRAGAQKNQFRLTAPVDGTVQQLNVHTLGGVVSAAQPLMVIVPAQSQVEIEAIVENKDIGFIRQGQRAAVKVEAYDYTRYGMVQGVVSWVARDAMNAGSAETGAAPAAASAEAAKPQASQYAIHVRLDRKTIDVDGREVALRPGMSTSIEIKTGSRRVIDYFLSPLIQNGHESLNER